MISLPKLNTQAEAAWELVDEEKPRTPRKGGAEGAEMKFMTRRPCRLTCSLIHPVVEDEAGTGMSSSAISLQEAAEVVEVLLRATRSRKRLGRVRHRMERAMLLRVLGITMGVDSCTAGISQTLEQAHCKGQQGAEEAAGTRALVPGIGVEADGKDEEEIIKGQPTGPVTGWNQTRKLQHVFRHSSMRSRECSKLKEDCIPCLEQTRRTNHMAPQHPKGQALVIYCSTSSVTRPRQAVREMRMISMLEGPEGEVGGEAEGEAGAGEAI
mmetsp:Transcript_7044/g.11091  ORF Transcript_7044/g.11091 Transcript_7044/m.11091 type:complete len:268 (-) Transcript_7044:560-1363(-)